MPETGASNADETGPAPVDPIVPVFREWAILKAQVTESTTRMNKLRDKVAEAVERRGYRDHKGSQYIDLPFPIPVYEHTYTKIKRERRVTTVADTETAERITRANGVYERAFPPVPTLDVDELYVLYQEGALTQDDMDAILVQREAYAFRGLTA